MKLIEVVAAIIIHDNKILCVQRGHSKYDYISNKFEFPGGKIENDETKEEAIIREVMEELKMLIEVKKEFHTVTHQYPDFSLTMYSFICSCIDPSLSLTEHISYAWLEKKDLSKLDWATADLPIVAKLMKY